jgi:hypothetical protein
VSSPEFVPNDHGLQGDLLIYFVSLAPIIYTPEGGEILTKLWRETLNELAFAGLQEILNSLVL